MQVSQNVTAVVGTALGLHHQAPMVRPLKLLSNETVLRLHGLHSSVVAAALKVVLVPAGLVLNCLRGDERFARVRP